MSLKQSEYINIQIANGGFVLTYNMGDAPGGEQICEVVPNQRKLINRLKELIAEKSFVPAA